MSAEARPSASVRHVLVVADHDKPGVRTFEANLLRWLRARVESVSVEGDARELVRRRSAMDAMSAARDLPDLIVVLGGDGAILAVARAFGRHPVPTLGINFGRVGFLASVPSGHWREALEPVLAGEGVLEPRMRLVADFPRAGKAEAPAIALNDAVVARGATQGMLVLGLAVDGVWVTDYRADGLIVATPSGSTAHSLSAGGPVLTPTVDAMVVTPICPQGLSYRPLVVHPESELQVEVRGSSGLTTLALDGQGFYPMREGECVTITADPVGYPLLRWDQLDPYRRLRERLGWSGMTAPEERRPPAQPHADAGHGGVL